MPFTNLESRHTSIAVCMSIMIMAKEALIDSCISDILDIHLLYQV